MNNCRTRTTAKNSPDNLPSYPSDNHCSDVIGRGSAWEDSVREGRSRQQARRQGVDCETGRRYGNWRHVATGCNALVFTSHARRKMWVIATRVRTAEGSVNVCLRWHEASCRHCVTKFPTPSRIRRPGRSLCSPGHESSRLSRSPNERC